jgi:sugar lactone lactonase YvrE
MKPGGRVVDRLQIELVANDGAGHAESPLWSPEEGALYWVDTRPGIIHRIDGTSGKRDVWTTPTRLGALGLQRAGLIVAIKTGIGMLDTGTGAFEHVVDPEADRPDSRINDAKTDRAGRFWFGYQQDDARTPTGSLSRMDPDRTVTVVDRNYTNPNGIAWSLDNRLMYVAETASRVIYVYDFDFASGVAANRRIFAEIPENEGRPDGTTVDSEGYIWSARNGGARIVRYAPDASIDRIVELPTTLVTNMTFGGNDMHTLYITTASRGLTAEQLTTQPLAGAILSVRVEVAGVAEPLFAG